MTFDKSLNNTLKSFLPLKKLNSWFYNILTLKALYSFKGFYGNKFLLKVRLLFLSWFSSFLFKKSQKFQILKFAKSII